MEHYTYIHKTDAGRVFYVGKGKDRRAWAKNKRNTYWQRVAKKHGLQVEIVARWTSEAEAFEHEKFLILCFKDMGCELVNMTDGGDGLSGWRHSAETIAKIKASNIGKKRSPDVSANWHAVRADWLERGIKEHWTPERRLAASNAMAGDKHPNFGKKFSDELRAKLSKSHKGQRHESVLRPVRCIETGCVFAAGVDAARWLHSQGMSNAKGAYISAAARGKFPNAYGYHWEVA